MNERKNVEIVVKFKLPHDVVEQMEKRAGPAGRFRLPVSRAFVTALQRCYDEGMLEGGFELVSVREAIYKEYTSEK